MFVLLGGLLVSYGWLGPTEIYRRSLGLNINLAWGLVMLLFGAAMLALRNGNGSTKETQP